jgi:hypothetical protein
VILDHSNLHGDGNWSCIAFIGLLCGHPRAISADFPPRSDAEAYVQTPWNPIRDLLSVGFVHHDHPDFAMSVSQHKMMEFLWSVGFQ